MAIASYSDLVEAVANWLDNTDLTDRIPEFVALAEAEFNRILRTTEMETIATSTAVSEDTITPDGFLQMRSLYTTSPQGQRYLLNSMALAGMVESYAPGATQPGPAEAYALIGYPPRIRIAPEPSATLTAPLTMVYWTCIPSLADNATNWLLHLHPDAYLFGTLVQATAYTVDDDRIGLWVQALDKVMSQITMQGIKNSIGAGPLIPQGIRQVRGCRV